MPVSALGQMNPGRFFLFHHLRLTAQPGFQCRTSLCTIRSDDPSVLFRGRIDGDDTVGTVAERHRFREGIAKKALLSSTSIRFCSDAAAGSFSSFMFAFSLNGFVLGQAVKCNGSRPSR